MGNEICFRAASEKDAAVLLEIYAPYVRGTAITFEYEVPSEEEFAGRIAKTLTRYPYLIALADGKEVGYAYASPFHDGRAAYGWAAECSIYLRQDCRRKGIGRALYGFLEQILAAQHIFCLTASIAFTDRETDPFLSPASIRFHERVGYQKAAHFHRCGWKFDRWYDIVWMEKHLMPADKEVLPVIPFLEIRGQFDL